ncbi:hypothetical protein HG531_006658 [Fusarium graminearum]|nr:hypothetical protein HG531_006658 [Fusarium graminearum]
MSAPDHLSLTQEYLRTSKTNSLDTKSQQLDNIATISDTTVGNNLGLGEDLRGIATDLVGDFERRGRVVNLATAVLIILSLVVLYVRIGGVVTSSAMANGSSRSIDGPDKSLDTLIFSTLHGIPRNREICIGVNLLEDGVTTLLALSTNLLDGLGSIQSSDVEDIFVSGSIDKVKLTALLVTVTSTGSGRDKDGSAEVVTQNGNSKCLVKATDTSELVRSKSGLFPNLEVVAVRPLSRSGSAVKGVLLVSQGLTSSKVKVGNTTDVLEERTTTLGPVGAGEVSVHASVRLVHPSIVGRGGSRQGGNES